MFNFLYQHPGSSNLIGWQLEVSIDLDLLSVTRIKGKYDKLRNFSYICFIGAWSSSRAISETEDNVDEERT